MGFEWEMANTKVITEEYNEEDQLPSDSLVPSRKFVVRKTVSHPHNSQLMKQLKSLTIKDEG